MASLCFSTSDPAAVNATKLYDYNNDDANLWIRQSQLPPCSSSLSPPEFLCLVCLQILVYAVCTNLTSGVKVEMEGVGVPIQIVQSECPRLLSDVVENTTVDGFTVDQGPSGQLSGAHISIIVCAPVLVILIALVLCRCWRLKRRNELQSKNEAEPLKQVQVQNGGDHMVQADDV